MLPKMALNIGQSEISGLIWRIANDLVGINDQTCFLFGELYIYIYIYILIYIYIFTVHLFIIYSLFRVLISDQCEIVLRQNQL